MIRNLLMFGGVLGIFAVLLVVMILDGFRDPDPPEFLRHYDDYRSNRRWR